MKDLKKDLLRKLPSVSALLESWAGL